MRTAVKTVLRGRLRFAAKWTLAHLLFITGVLYVLKRILLRHRAIVLTYHRVLSDDDCGRTWSHPAIVVRRRTFDTHIAILRRLFRPLTLEEFASHLVEDRPFPDASCLVTFDDGWRDTCTEAWPILRRHGVPATTFLSVGLIDTPNVLWQERLRALLFEAYRHSRAGDQSRTAVTDVLRRHGYGDVLEADMGTVRRVIFDAVASRKYDDPEVALAPIDDLARLLENNSAASPGPDGFMTWSMVQSMAAEGSSFGGHGVTHRLLTTLPMGQVEAEVVGSREAIRAKLGTVPTAFAYPDGKWTEAIAACLASSGFTLGFSTDAGRVCSGDNRWVVRRLNIHEGSSASPAMFLAHLVGIL